MPYIATLEHPSSHPIRQRLRLERFRLERLRLGSVSTGLRRWLLCGCFLAVFWSTPCQWLGQGSVHAQQLTLAATAREDAVGLRFAVRDVSFAGWTLGAHVAVREVLAGQLEASRRTTFGPVGSVLVAAEAGVNTDGQSALTFAATGNVGAFGARVGLLVYNAHAVAFDVRALTDISRPHYAAQQHWAFGLDMSGTYRLSRRVLITASPTLLYLTDTGLGGRVLADVTWRRALATDNISLLLASELHPAGDEGYVAFAGQYQLARRGLPLVTASLWLAANDGLQPGGRVAVAARPGMLPVGYEVTFAAEPFQVSAPAYRAAFDSYLPLARGMLELTAVTAWGERAELLELNSFNISLGYALDF